MGRLMHIVSFVAGVSGIVVLVYYGIGRGHVAAAPLAVAWIIALLSVAQMKVRRVPLPLVIRGMCAGIRHGGAVLIFLFILALFLSL